MNILITGSPGIGKTRLIKELAEKLAGKATGFYTEEIRKEGRSSGFRIKTLNGKTGILASVDMQSPYRMGKYKVDLDCKEVTLKAFDSSNSVVATIKQKSFLFTESLKTRSDVAMYVLEHDNREEVAEKILRSLNRAIEGRYLRYQAIDRFL